VNCRKEVDSYDSHPIEIIPKATEIETSTPVEVKCMDP
jgi:hypothetical protein